MTAKTAIVKRCGLVGAGAGIALFAVFGLLQGALLGGTAGVAVANHIFGANTFEVMAGDVLPRIIVAACMVAGVGVAFAILVSAGTMIGVVSRISAGAGAAEGRNKRNQARAGSKQGQVVRQYRIYTRAGRRLVMKLRNVIARKAALVGTGDRAGDVRRVRAGAGGDDRRGNRAGHYQQYNGGGR